MSEIESKIKEIKERLANSKAEKLRYDYVDKDDDISALIEIIDDNIAAEKMWAENKEELWESIELIYDFISDLSVGSLLSKNVIEPRPKIYAQKIIEAIGKMEKGTIGHWMQPRR